MASELLALHKPVAATLPHGWEWKRLDAICEGVFDCPHSTPLLTKVGPYVVRSQDIRSGAFRSHEAAHVSDETYRHRIARAEPRHGDLLYSREGTYFGIAAEVPRGVRLCLGQRMVLLRPQASTTHSRFLLYWLNSPLMASHIHGFRDGSVAERLNMPTIRGLPVALPPISEQRAIARMLGTLDDKIELNQRISETLEEMARALFKSWFVDFDPVRRKMERQDARAQRRKDEGDDGIASSRLGALALPPHLEALFPDRLVDSELGEIPDGWEVQEFADTVDVIGGGTPKTSIPEYWGGDIPWFSVVDAPSSSDIWVVDTEKKVTQRGIEASSTRLLSVGTTIISARGTVGRVALVGVPMAMNQSCYGLRGKQGPKGFYCYFATRALVSVLQQRAHGSVFDTITRDTLAGVPTVVPVGNVVSAFERLVGPLVEYVLSQVHQSRTLAALRDTLLPKLISGEMRVPSAERIVRNWV